MRSKAEMRSKLRHYLQKPRKILHRARDFYVKSMEDCANKVSTVGCPAAQVFRLPRSFSVNYSKATNDDRFRELLAAVSKKMESDVVLDEIREKEWRQYNMENSSMKRSYTSVGLGRIGRIDEDKPCHFEEDMLYARSRSYATKRYFEYF